MSDGTAMKDKRKKSEPDPLLFDDIDSLKEVADQILPQHHSHLVGAGIRYIGRSRAAKRAGIPVPGNVYKMSGKFRHLVGVDFVVEVALDLWNNMTLDQRTALTDHLLSRIVGVEDEVSGAMKWSIRQPSVQEFPEVAERHGEWNDGLVELGRCLKS
jgi:hypothetical protein